MIANEGTQLCDPLTVGAAEILQNCASSYGGAVSTRAFENLVVAAQMRDK